MVCLFEFSYSHHTFLILTFYIIPLNWLSAFHKPATDGQIEEGLVRVVGRTLEEVLRGIKNEKLESNRQKNVRII